jgi:hypothetical protein
MIGQRISTGLVLLFIFVFVFSLLQFVFTGDYFVFLTLTIVTAGIIFLYVAGILLLFFIYNIWKQFMFVITGKEDWL